jgi:hypothetical protein
MPREVDHGISTTNFMNASLGRSLLALYPATPLNENDFNQSSGHTAAVVSVHVGIGRRVDARLAKHVHGWNHPTA